YFTATAPPDIYPLSLHDALPICQKIWLTCARGACYLAWMPPRCPGDGRTPRRWLGLAPALVVVALVGPFAAAEDGGVMALPPAADRKSTRLNSSHVAISYAVFCL